METFNSLIGDFDKPIRSGAASRWHNKPQVGPRRRAESGEEDSVLVNRDLGEGRVEVEGGEDVVFAKRVDNVIYT